MMVMMLTMCFEETQVKSNQIKENQTKFLLSFRCDDVRSKLDR